MVGGPGASGRSVRAVTTYCAPCLADLALVREAATAVGGTASCMAHAVLLTHPSDDPQRRRQRLAQLRETAAEKIATAGPEEQVRLELLVEEYSLAAAMESLVPRRRPDDAGQLGRGARKRRGRDGRERPEPGRPRGEHDGPRPGGPSPEPRRPAGQQASEPGAAPSQAAAPETETAPAAGETASAAGETAPAAGHAAGAATGGAAVTDGTAEQAGARALEQVGAPSGEPPVPTPSAAPAPSPAPAPAPSPSGDATPSRPVETAQRDSGPPASDAGAPATGAPAPAAPAPGGRPEPAPAGDERPAAPPAD